MKRREMQEKARLRGEHVVNLYDKEKWTFQEIGDYLGSSRQNARRLYKEQKARALKRK